MHYLSVAVLAAADLFSRYYVSSESAMTEKVPGYGALTFQVAIPLWIRNRLVGKLVVRNLAEWTEIYFKIMLILCNVFFTASPEFFSNTIYTLSFQGFSNMVVPHKPLFDINNLIQSSFLRQQIAGIVFHTLAAFIVTFFLDLHNSREKVRSSWNKEILPNEV